MNKAIILGNDHTNSIGLIHSLGRCGVYTIVVVWGRKTGMVPASKYVSEFYSAASPQACMDLIIEKYANTNDTFVVFPGCDGAAVALEEYRDKLSTNFLFQHVDGPNSLKELDNKKLQVEIAEKSGFRTPKSWNLESLNNIPEDIVFPCIIKSLVAMEGSKSDLLVCENQEQLKTNLTLVLSRTPRVQVQQYIEKDFDFDVMGCRFSDGKVYIPVCLKKLGIFPPKVGLATVSETTAVPDEIIEAASNYIKEVGYYGIFDFEYMHSTIDNKNYFIECNLRNSGSNAFALRAGYNLPLYHFKDLTGNLQDSDINRGPIKSRYYIRELNHWFAFRNHHITAWRYLIEELRSSGNLTWCWNDPKPFFKEIMPFVKSTLRIKNNKGKEYYE
jgi:predicted ATP-grasp superfamily ATP-dependent carboligase